MSKFIDYAISHARLTIVTLLFLLLRRFRGLCHDSEGGRAGRSHPDRLRPADTARHQPGGFRAPAAAAGRDAAQVRQQRQGNALDRLRGRRLRAARVRGGLRFQVGAGGRARQGRSGQARSAEGRRRAERAGGQPVALSGAGGGAVRPGAGADHAADRARGQERGRAGSRRAVGGTARLPRRGGRDHRRADAVEKLRRLARPAHRRVQRLQQPDRRRRAGRLDRTLRREGAEPDRAAAGRPEDSDGRVERRRRHRRRRRADQADLQGRHVGDPRQRPCRP